MFAQSTRGTVNGSCRSCFVRSQGLNCAGDCASWRTASFKEGQITGQLCDSAALHSMRGAASRKLARFALITVTSMAF